MALFDDDLRFGSSYGAGRGSAAAGSVELPPDALYDFGADGVDVEDDIGADTKQLRDAVLLVIDCTRPSATSPLREGGRSLVAEGLSAAATLLKRKVVSAPDDKVGVALYGVREKLNPNSFEGIRVLQELDRPSAQRIKQLEAEITRTPASFQERYGLGHATPLSDVFWTCTTVLNLAAPTKQFEPRVWLFTSNDSPCEGQGEREAAETRARDLQDLGVSIEFFPLPFGGAPFTMERFWDRVISFDAEDFVDRAVMKLENLERWIRMREHRKRTLQRLSLHLCSGAEIGVSIYCTSIEAKIPQPVHLLNENNKLLKSETRSLCGSTGAILHPIDDVETFVELAGQRVYASPAEVAEIKNFGEPGMHLLGFKPARALQPQHRIFHSYFVYPNERAVKGSSALCRALIDTMLERKLMAVVRHVARKNAPPCLAALLPQAEMLDEDGVPAKSPGFHMVRLPWGEEIRSVDLPTPELPAPSPDLLAAARRVVASMRLDGFRPGCAENPVLQRHYAAVQALALGEDKPAETVDVLQPDVKALEEKAPIFHEWRAAIDSATAAVKAASPPAKRAAIDCAGAGDADWGGGAEAVRAVRPRREPAPAAPTTLEGMREMVHSGEVDRLTVSALKDFLKTQGVVSSGKKADLVDRVRAIV